MARLPDTLLFALVFFTRLRLPVRLADRMSADMRLADAGPAFPIAGLAIGIFVSLVWWAANAFLDPVLAAGIAIAAGLLLTGALHEDGLADCADGLGATHDRERVLEIMRDSTIGSYGALALLVSLGLRWAALGGFGIWEGACALIIAHCGSRAAMTLATGLSRYARPQGLGSQAADMPKQDMVLAGILALLAALVFGAFAGALSLLAGYALAWGFLKYLENRIGGYTGDGLGAMQQLCEITVLLTLAGFWS
jgi:adenosylcobinamide-GDP ribazoletransferase